MVTRHDDPRDGARSAAPDADDRRRDTRRRLFATARRRRRRHDPASWLEWLVVFFPGQERTRRTAVAFAQRFGEVTVGHPVEPTLADPPRSTRSTAEGPHNFWHTDVTFMARPPMGSMLGRSRCRTSAATRCGRHAAAYEAWPPLPRSATVLGVHYDEHYATVVANGDANEWDGVKLDGSTRSSTRSCTCTPRRSVGTCS